MTVMTCPVIGRRKISEFIRGREVKEMPDPSTCSNETWASRLFMANDVAREVAEWWMHAPTSYWFIARRNTVTNEIVETYTVEEFFGAAADTGVDKAAA